MDAKYFNAVVEDVNRAQSRYTQMRAYFDEFCKSAARYTTESNAPVKGITVKRDGDALSMTFLDRSVRVTMHFDRANGKGLLRVADNTRNERVLPGTPPKVLLEIRYNGAGESDVPGETSHEMINLGDEGERVLLTLRLIDIVLDQAP